MLIFSWLVKRSVKNAVFEEKKLGKCIRRMKKVHTFASF